MKKVYDWVANKRLLDGYIGILGVVLFYKIIAQYHNTVYLFSVSAKAGKVPLFNIDLSHWRRGISNNIPLIRLQVSILKWQYDSAAKEIKALHEWAVENSAKWKAEQAENERLIFAAKVAGL